MIWAVASGKGAPGATTLAALLARFWPVRMLSRGLIGMANGLVDRFGGEVPSALEDLVTRDDVDLVVVATGGVWQGTIGELVADVTLADGLTTTAPATMREPRRQNSLTKPSWMPCILARALVASGTFAGTKPSKSARRARAVCVRSSTPCGRRSWT